jgi:23S rRNA (guanine745-N1)-methyltransferase
VIPIACTVRGCGAPLRREDARYIDDRGHSFDIARSGYVNLLQPQDRRSREPGDAADAVAARRRLLDAGAGAALIEALAATVAELGLPPQARALDIGSGEGSILGALAGRFGWEAAGIELSARAADLAARRHPGVLWLVANADRGLPLADGSIDLILSITARRSPGECARVLAPGGRLVVAVPAPDDLAELREKALGRAAREDRAAKVIEEHEGHFEPAGRRECRDRKRFTAAQLEDLLVATYRSGRAGRRDRVSALDGLSVTLSHEIVVFRPRIIASR